MRTSKPQFYDPEVIELLWKRDRREDEQHRAAVRIWTLVGILFLIGLTVEAVTR